MNNNRCQRQKMLKAILSLNTSFQDNLIDKLFKESFANYKLPTPKTPIFLEETLNKTK